MSDWEEVTGRLAADVNELRQIADAIGAPRLTAAVDRLAEDLEEELSEGVESVSDDRRRAYATFARMSDLGHDADSLTALSQKLRLMLVALAGQVKAHGDAELQGTLDAFGRTFVEFMALITPPAKAEEPAEVPTLLHYTPAKKRPRRKPAGSPLKKALKDGK